MNLTTAKAGQQYRLYTDNDDAVVAVQTTKKTVVGTIIALSNDGTKVLFGWKSREKAPTNSRHRDGIHTSSSYKYHSTQREYDHSLTMSSNGVVHSKVREPGEMDGCVCNKCHNFYPYAEPNQEDGTLICYSCRTIW
jgi:hypothetical protein